MAHVLLIVNRKGGVGKTTTAVHLAEAWAQDTDVVLVDADAQQQAARWLSNWTQTVEVSPNTRRPPERLSVVGVPDGKASSVDRLLAGDGIVVIDAPGGADPAMAKRREVLYKMANAVLMPCGASVADVLEVIPTAKEVAELAPELPAAVALVGVRSRADAAVAELRDALENRHGVTVLAAQVRDSAHVERSYGKPTSRIGRDEYALLAAELREALGW
jgi:chromosome partitioning protein